LRFCTLLLLLVYSNVSLALGLGEAELKSHLGEKFLAKVNVTDLDAQSESSCFTATDISDAPAFKKANVTLKPDNSGYQLTITTNDVVTEPIVNLRISFHCEPNIYREYVLLLDPAPLPAMEKASVEDNINVEPINSSSAKNKKPAHSSSSKKIQNQDYQDVTDQAGEISLDNPILKNPAKKKKRPATNSVNEKLIESYTGKQKTEITPESSFTSENKTTAITANSHQSTDKPFLVISGGSASSNESANKPSLSLRLATEIDFTRPEAVIAPSTATDAMDEVTVMANRLAHLEKQIASLQNRNTQLVADAAKAKEESEHFNWQQVLLISISIIAALAAAEWLRRRMFSQRSNSEGAEWFDTAASIDSANETAVLSDSYSNNSFEAKRSSELSLNEPDFGDSSSQSAGFDGTGTVVTFEKEEHGSVIDDADVFIEHGRPALAIQLLQNHLVESPAESPAIWFKLLNLLAKESSEADYDEAVVECNKHFNIKAAKFGDTSENDNSSIEDYPHITSRLEGVWGSQFALGFLNDLIYNKRSQPREGLEQAAFEDLFFLKLIAQRLDTSSPPTQQRSLHQSNSAKPVFENASFNEALFAEVEPLDDMKTSSASSQNDIEFNSRFDTTNGVSALGGDSFAEQPNLNADASNVETVPYQHESPYEVDLLLNAEATPVADSSLETIGFSLPQHSPMLEIEESLKAEEIIFTASTEEFKSKPKTKTKAKSSAQKHTELNEIEWDLPE